MKKIIVLILVLSITLLFSGCANEVSNTPNEDDVVDVENKDVDGAEKMLIKIAHPQPVNSPEDIAVQKLAEEIRNRAGDQVEVEVYPALQIGSIPEMIESTQMGVIQMCMGPTAIIASFAEDMKLMDLPYLLPRDTEVIDRVLNSEVGEEFLTRLDPAGFHGLGFWFAGHKMMSTSDQEIHNLEDMKGLKMRIMQSPILASQYKAWGASAVPLPYAELYNSLQQGVVDGQENPVQSIYLNNLHEVQENVIATYHGTITHALMANKAWFDSLPTDLQQVLIESEKVARVELKDAVERLSKEYVQGIIDSGTNYYEFTDEEVAMFAEASEGVYDEFLQTEWQKEYFPRLKAKFDEEADR